MTLSEILDTVLLESGMPTETSYADNDDDSVKRLVNIANRSLQKLARHPWQALRKTWTQTLTEATEYPLPDDWRAFVPDTMFTENHLWPVNFPTDEGQWAYLQASGTGAGPRVQCRILQGQLHVYQPVSGETLRVEYISKYPVLNGTTYKEKFTADDDTCLLDDDLVSWDILWRYKKLMGHNDWQADLAECKALQIRLWGQDEGSQTIRPGYEMGDTTPYYNLWRPFPNSNP